MRRVKMNKKFVVLITLVMIAALFLTACERPATRSTMATPTAIGEIPFPVATQSKNMIDILKGTQTAAALTPGTGGVAPLITSTPAFTFSTPEPTVEFTPTSTAIAYPTPTPGKPTTYTVQAGEFLYCLARRFNVNPADLFTANGMNNNSKPAIGTKLNIPQSGSFPGTRALKAHPATYTVLAGDTIGKIACTYGDADPNTIFAANGLTTGASLSAGQVLQIP
jgi:LysM repeat protein